MKRSLTLETSLASPAAGCLIYNYGWWARLVILGTVSLIFAVLVWSVLPITEYSTVHKLDPMRDARVFAKLGVLASLVVALCPFFFGVGTFAPIWSIWLSADFGLMAVGLGLVATTFGLAEQIGSRTSGLFIDGLCKRHSGISGLLLAAGAFLILPRT